MISYNDHKQQQLFDPWGHLSPKRRQMLDRSWPGLFQKFILPELPVSEISPFFNAGFGRPTKDLYTALGVLVLKETHDLTDFEAVDQLSYNIQWHYALNITEESDSAKYMCPKTLWNMRMIVAENGLEAILFNAGTQKLAEVFNIDPDKQRIVSFHIQSNMRKLGRITIFSNSIHKFVSPCSLNLDRPIFLRAPRKGVKMGGFSCLELIGLKIEKEGDAVRRWDLVSGIRIPTRWKIKDQCFQYLRAQNYDANISLDAIIATL